MVVLSGGFFASLFSFFFLILFTNGSSGQFVECCKASKHMKLLPYVIFTMDCLIALLVLTQHAAVEYATKLIINVVLIAEDRPAKLGDGLTKFTHQR